MKLMLGKRHNNKAFIWRRSFCPPAIPLRVCQARQIQNKHAASLRPYGLFSLKKKGKGVFQGELTQSGVWGGDGGWSVRRRTKQVVPEVGK